MPDTKDLLYLEMRSKERLLGKALFFISSCICFMWIIGSVKVQEEKKMAKNSCGERVLSKK